VRRRSGVFFDLYVCGARIERMVGFGPLSGAAANVTLFSYRGECALGIATDPAAIPDPETFVGSLRRGLDEVLALGGDVTAPATP
jgi:hypothetical protein